MDCILKYFPNLSETQINQFKQLGVLYPEWNEKINVISRKDIDKLNSIEFDIELFNNLVNITNNNDNTIGIK